MKSLRTSNRSEGLYLSGRSRNDRRLHDKKKNDLRSTVIPVLSDQVTIDYRVFFHVLKIQRSSQLIILLFIISTIRICTV